MTIISDLKLTNAHDLFIKNNQLVLCSGAEQKRQQIKITLLTFLNEWDFDTSVGIPYLEQFFVKSADKTKIEALLRKKILEIESVIRVDNFALNLDRKNRNLSITFSAETTQGYISDIQIIKGANNE